MRRTIWIVTEHYNDYNQHGGYFKSAHTSYEKALEHAGHDGREAYEYVWCEINEEVLDE